MFIRLATDVSNNLHIDSYEKEKGIKAVVSSLAGFEAQTSIVGSKCSVMSGSTTALNGWPVVFCSYSCSSNVKV